MNRARSVASRILPADSAIGRMARLASHRLGLAAPHYTTNIINHFARSEPNATFIQIGANDGVALDPLHDAIAHTQWTGIMVEPVPYVAERLRVNMAGNPRVTIDMVAIAEEDGEKDFYHLAEAESEAEVWEWYHALGSFDRDVLLKHTHLIPDIDSRLVATSVPCMTFDSLCERHGLSSVDVIQMDTEGYDHVIMGLIDLQRYRPKLVMYEQLHLPPSIRRDIEHRLDAAGYEFFSDWMDTLAVGRESLQRDPALAKLVRSAQRANRRYAA